MQSETLDLDFTQIVGKSATISVLLTDGSTRYINGIVSRFVQAGSGPALRHLSRRAGALALAAAT